MSLDDPTDEELARLLARRADVLAFLGDGPRTKRELVGGLDVSRSTVDRAIRELERAGLVEGAEGGYVLATAGELLLAAYERFTGTARDVLTADELLSYLPPGAPLDPIALRDAEPVVPGEVAAYQPARRIGALIEDAEHVTGMSRAHTQPDAVDIYHRRIVEEGMTMTVVFERAMYEHLESMDDERVQAVLGSDRVTAYATEGVPYGLFVIESADGSRLCLVVYDEDNVLRGLLVNDGEEAVGWAEGVVRRYLDAAERVA